VDAEEREFVEGYAVVECVAGCGAMAAGGVFAADQCSWNEARGNKVSAAEYRLLKRRLSRMILSGSALVLLAFAFVAGCGSGAAPSLGGEATKVTPTDDPIGERLFLDTRFSQYFATHMTGINAPLAVGDPVVGTVSTPGGVLPGPFAGKAINCRSCHFVTEFQGVAGAGNRTYSDFVTRSTLPIPMNGYTTTPRNAMQMVGTFQQHASGEDLVVGTMTGRNFGWSPSEYNAAIAQIAAVIRGDDGSDDLAQSRTNGLSYGILFKGVDSRIPSSILLLPAQRIDVTTATDMQIVNLVATCIAQYFKDLKFKQDAYGRYVTSPYDVFLNANHLPMQPLAGETGLAYNQRLYQQVLALTNPVYVTPNDGAYAYHSFPFQFGATELAGLKIFLKAAVAGSGNDQHAGNCASCHTAPDFTDFGFHTTGVSQDEYDGVHGQGAFMALHVPGLTERNANYDEYLPRTSTHPNATEAMRRAASAGNPLYADLGMWNIYLNPAGFVCAAGKDCSVDQGLASTIAQFKTPMLRDLTDSAPYFHNGSRATFDDVVEFYIKSSALAKAGQLRNAPSQFNNMSLSDDDVQALVAFLVSLTEDYDDA
jgi:cytochrome c peroxidase